MLDDIIHESRFANDLAAKAAGMSPNLLKSWIGQGFINDETFVDENHKHDLHRPGKGRARLFSFAQVMRLAIAKELTGYGFAVGAALTHSLRFTYTGTPYAYWPASGASLPSKSIPKIISRTPGFLHKHTSEGRECVTWFAASGKQSQVISISPDELFQEAIEKIEFDPNPKDFGESNGLVMLNLSRIWGEVISGLSFDPLNPPTAQ